MGLNTTEAYVQAVRDVVVVDALLAGRITEEEADRLRHVKLLYGIGDGSYRGVCVYEAWENGVGRVDVVEIAATGQESWVQLAGTVIHELGHVLTGKGHGHDKTWKDTAHRIGFTKGPEAAGQIYRLALLSPTIREKVYELARIVDDGSPAFRMIGLGALGMIVPTVRPCSAGVGARGGTSRGKGSGSRLRLYECSCSPKPVKVRVASDDFLATCDVCGESFVKVEKPASKDEAGTVGAAA